LAESLRLSICKGAIQPFHHDEMATEGEIPLLEPRLLAHEQEIDAALETNLAALKDGLCDLLAAFILLVISLVSFLHALLRIVFSTLGLLLWAVALFIAFLYAVRAWAVARSASTLHRKE
jgi:ABC-type uncharacterized transport system fused permease/ATPase subunit